MGKALEPPTTVDGWDTARARFSHDWLKNGFSVALGKFTNVLTGAVEDPDAANQVLAYLDEWPAKREEIERLIDIAPVILSPVELFRQGPLSALDDQSRNTLATIIEEKWRNSVQPERMVRDAKTFAQRVDTACEALKESMMGSKSGTSGGKANQAIRVDGLRIAILEFAEALSVLGRSRYVV